MDLLLCLVFVCRLSSPCMDCSLSPDPSAFAQASKSSYVALPASQSPDYPLPKATATSCVDKFFASLPSDLPNELIDLSCPKSKTAQTRPKLGAIRKGDFNRNSASLEMKTCDLESVESSDTFASCFTHPFNSLDDVHHEETFGRLLVSPMSISFELCPLNTTAADQSDWPCAQSAASHCLERNTKATNLVLPPFAPNCDRPSASHYSRRSRFVPTSVRRTSEVISSVEHSAKSTLPRWIALKAKNRQHEHNKSADNVFVDGKANSVRQKKSILKKPEHYSTCSNLQAHPEETESLLPEVFESPQSVRRQVMPHLGSSPSTEKDIHFDDIRLLTDVPVHEATTVDSRARVANGPVVSGGASLCRDSSELTEKEHSAKEAENKLNPRLIGALLPTTRYCHPRVALSTSELAGSIRCSNPQCLFHSVTQSVVPFCGACGHRVELVGPLRSRSAPLTPDCGADLVGISFPVHRLPTD